MKFLFLLSSCWCYATLQEVTSHMLSNEQIGKNNKILSFSQYLHIFCWHPCKQKGRPRFFIRSGEKKSRNFSYFLRVTRTFCSALLEAIARAKFLQPKWIQFFILCKKFTLHIWDDDEGFLHWKSEKLALNGLVLHAELDKITIPLKTFTKRRFVQHHLLTQLKLDFCIGKN